MSKTNGGNVDTYEFPYMRKPKGKTSIWRGIYNPDKNYILGRTPRNWGSLIAFYTIFYIVLSAVFAICMQGLLSTLSENEPKWQLGSSLIGSNPGVGLRPLPDDLNRGSLIWYAVKNQTQVDYWTGRLNEFLQPYTNKTVMAGGGRNQVPCSFEKRAEKGQVCAANIDQDFGECTYANNFGYDKSRPCIFLKLNKIYNWEPDYYRNDSDLPPEMPEDLKKEIIKIPLNQTIQRNQVWVSCNGTRSADRENLNGFKYYPSRGFPGYFYPFTNTPGYLSPLIAVQILHPTPHRIINIECRAWAKNILYNGSQRDRQGSIHFELMLD